MTDLVKDLDGPGVPSYGVKKKATGKKARRECAFNSGVLCNDRKCEGCGFNPRKNTEKSEYIEKDAVIKMLGHRIEGEGLAYDFINSTISILEDTVKAMPAADAEPVVRCKDCRHRSDEMSEGKYFCNHKMLGLVRASDFCSYGDRKDGGA